MMISIPHLGINLKSCEKQGSLVLVDKMKIKSTPAHMLKYGLSYSGYMDGIEKTFYIQRSTLTSVFFKVI